MHISSKQSGSALLTVLLILTALAAIMLFATKSALTSTRNLSREDNASLARQMAQSGIDEGLLQLKKNGVTSPTPNSANPSVVSTGFVPNSGCQTLQSDSSGYDTSCPYYSFVVRDYLSVTSTGTDSNNGRFQIVDQDLLQNQVLTLKSSGSASLVFTTGDVTITGSGTSQTNGYTTKNEGDTLSITKKVSALATPITISSTTGSFIIERPQLVIEATGYAGGIQKKLLYTIPRYPADQTPRTLVDFGGSFDPYGFLK